jgi:hypothetical protein
MKKKPDVFRTKLGPAKQVERSRIWIEGKRLVDAGFTVGQYFVQELTHKKGAPVLTLTLLTEDDVLAIDPCKVSGKGDKPIIDITGQRVRNVFGAIATHVDVTYAPGKITIRAAAE